MKDGSDDPLHHERTQLKYKYMYISENVDNITKARINIYKMLICVLIIITVFYLISIAVIVN